MKRSGLIEPIGLSMLDLICGLFGLIVVLFVITDRLDGSPDVTSSDLNFVRAQVESSETISYLVGLELELSTIKVRSWPDCSDKGSVRWGRCDPGLTEGLVEGDSKLSAVGIVLLSSENGTMIDLAPKQVFLMTKDWNVQCELKFEQGFRARVDLTAAEGNARCKVD